MARIVRPIIEDIIVAVSASISAPDRAAVVACIEDGLALMGRALEAERCFFFQLSTDHQRHHVRAEWHADGVPPILQGSADHVPTTAFPWATARILGGRPLVVHDVERLPAAAAVERARWREHGLRSLLIVPAFTRDDLAGGLGLDCYRPRRWGPRDVSMLQTVASVLVNAWERHEMAAALDHRLGSEHTLATIAADFMRQAPGHASQVTTDAMARLGEQAGVDRVFLFDLEPGGRVTGHREWCAPGARFLGEAATISASEVDWLVQRVRAGHTVHVPDLDALPPEAAAIGQRWSGQGLQSLLAVPLMVAGAVVGVIGFESERRRLTWSEADIQLLQTAGGIIADARQRQLVEATLREQMERAEAANRAKTMFLANMSHELRTPLNGLLGMASLLDDTALAAPQREMLGVIASTGDNLRRIIEDLLDFAKIEAGQLGLEPAPLDLDAAVAQAVAPLQPLARERGLRLEIHGAAGALGHVHGDAGRLRQVLSNLVHNALKFTDVGGVTVTVTARAATPGRVRITVAVADTGPGIPPDQQERIFAKFEQLDGSSTRRHGGTGLGLAICRELAALMQAELTLASEMGRGSVFTLTVELPLAGGTANPAPDGASDTAGDIARDTARDAARDTVRVSMADTTRGIARNTTAHDPPADATDNAPAAAAATATDDAPRVLLVEDNPVNQKVAQVMLQKLGCAVTVADHGAEAVAALRSGSLFDVVFMDCQMPVMDGLQATRAIRGLPGEASAVPIVALTAHAMAGDREACLAAGMDDYLTKPVRRDDLARVLAGLGAACCPA